MDAIFSLIPVKLLFIGLTFYIWKQLLQRGVALAQPAVSRWTLGFALFSLVLALVSIGKVYPYGVVTDLLVFAMAATLVMALPTRYLLARALAGLVLLLALALPLAYLQHFQVVGGALNKDSLIAVFQTNRSEALEYLASFTSLATLVPVALVLAMVTVIVQANANSRRQSLPLPVAALYLLLGVGMITLAPLEKGLFNYPLDVLADYHKELDTSRKRLAEFKLRQTDRYETVKEGQGELYLVIVGESLNKHHMGLYGYPLDTTPRLQQLADDGSLLVARQSFSNYPGTMQALSHALSESNQRNHKPYIQAVGIVELLNNAGFDTRWLGNQPLSNSYDMILGLIAKQAKQVDLTFDIEFHSMSHRNHEPDGVLLPLLEKAIADRDPSANTVIFMHLMGNHTNYCERYPPEFKKFETGVMDALWMHIFKGGLGHARECYDNSVLYNDFVVSSAIDLVRQSTGEQGVGGVVYFADHADDVTRGVGHSSANFSMAMVESPAMFWLSPGYQQHYAERTEALRGNIHRLYPNDFIFDSIIGMTATQVTGGTPASPIYCDSCDLFSAAYTLPADQAFTMHGKLAYKSAQQDDGLRTAQADKDDIGHGG